MTKLVSKKTETDKLVVKARAKAERAISKAQRLSPSSTAERRQVLEEQRDTAIARLEGFSALSQMYGQQSSDLYAQLMDEMREKEGLIRETNRLCGVVGLPMVRLPMPASTFPDPVL